MAGLLDWLGKRAQGVFAQINPFDNGEDYNSVVNGRPQPQAEAAPQRPAQPSRPINQPAPNRYGFTPGQRLVESPQFRNYSNELSKTNAAQKNFDLNESAKSAGKSLFEKPAQLINQTLGIAENLGANIGGETLRAFGDQQGGDRLIGDVKRHVDQNVLSEGKGLFGAGGLYNSSDQLHNANPLDVLTKAGGAGLETAANIAPVSVGARGADLTSKIIRGVGTGVLTGAAASAGNQLATNGRVDPLEVARQASTAGAVGAAAPLIARGVRSIVDPSKLTPPRLRNIPQRPEIPVQTPMQPMPQVAQVARPIPKPVAQPNRSIPVAPTYRDPNVTYNPSGDKATRGFAQSALDNVELPQDIRNALVENGSTYNVRNTQDLVSRAGNLVKDNTDLAERVANSGNNDVAQAVGIELLRKYQNEGNYEAAISRIEDIARKATESGRATQVLAAYGRLTPEGALRFTQRQLNRFNEERGLVGTKKAAKLDPTMAKRITELSSTIQKLPEGDDKARAIVELTQLMSTAAPTPLLQKLTSIWRAGLLSSARTLEGGVLGNTTKAVLDTPAQAISAGVDRFITAPIFNKGVRSNVFTPRGAAGGAVEGIKQAGRYLKTGVDPRDAQSAYDTKGVNWNNGNKVLNTVGKGSDYIYRALGAVDNPFYYSAKGRADFEEAFIEASKRGLKGSDARDFAKEYVQNMSPASRDAAAETAKEAVFQNDTILGNLASQFKALPKKIKDPVKRDAVQAIADFTVPFAKIPGAVATALADYSPVGVVLKTFQSIADKVGGRPVDLRGLNASIGKSATGSLGAVWLGKELYDRGLLTLEEPADDKEKQLWQAEGKQKFAIKIGDQWHSLNYIQPLAGLMALGGGYQRASKEGDPTPLLAAAGAGLKSVTEQSFLQGINDVVDLAQDPARNAASFVNSKVSSLIPNFVRDTARATDPFERETNNPGDAINNAIPGLRSKSLPQRDTYGAPIDRRQSSAGVFLNPFKSTDAKGDAVTSELRRLYDINPKELGVVPTKLDKSLSIGGENVQLTPEQLDNYEKVSGPLVRGQLEKILANPSYAKLSDEDKSSKIKSTIDNTRAAVKRDIAGKEKFVDKQGNSVKVDPSKVEVGKVSLTPSGERKTYKEKYEYARDKFNEDSPKMGRIERLKREHEVERLSVQKDFDNDTVDLYGMSKSDVYDFVHKDKKLGKDRVGMLLKYGDALVKAGITKRNKFRDKYGNLKLDSPGTKGGRSGRKKKGTKANVSGLTLPKTQVPTFAQPPSFGSKSPVNGAVYKQTQLRRRSSSIPQPPKITVRSGIV